MPRRIKDAKNHAFHEHITNNTAQETWAGIATRFGLDGAGIESRWEARFSAPLQTGPGAHPAPYTNGYRVFLGGKAARAWR